ncbi:MAG: arylsulfatase [Opitutaceae bacterium]|nr:arylsulfatase [Opitutaceae bacterium]
MTVLSHGKDDKRPNVVMIMVDDMGFSDIGCYGGEIATPNLDRLARNGLRFSRFHNTAKCFPSRACLLTGQYAQRVGMGDKPLSFTNAVTVAEVLQNSGYRTLMTGKHHGEENPVRFGFDRYWGLMDGASNHFNPGKRRAGEPVPANKQGNFGERKWGIDHEIRTPYTPEEGDFYSTDYFTNHAIGFLDQYKGESKPFFLYVAYTAPHDPLMAWPADIKKYIGSYMEGYESIRRKRYERQVEMGMLDRTYPLSAPTYEDWAKLFAEEKAARDAIMATYAAMIDRVDQNIGRLLGKLEELGQLANTIILFMSDNGAQSQSDPQSWLWARGKESDPSLPIGSVGRWTSLNLSWANVSNTPFRLYKADSHEGGIATPLIVSWKDKIRQPGRITAFPAHLIDIMPTLLHLIGASYPTHNRKGEEVEAMDGINLAPLFDHRLPVRGKPLYWQWANGKAIRKDNWKLVSDNNEPWELYDVSHDQTETDNVIDEYPRVAEELKREWQMWIGETKARESTRKPSLTGSR